jgi:hypothetical protein
MKIPYIHELVSLNGTLIADRENKSLLTIEITKKVTKELH